MDIFMSDFSEFNFVPSILSAIKTKGYQTPTPIQQQAIPHLLNGKDLLGIAQTGTGKTAAFSLPIINQLAKGGNQRKRGKTRVLILTPTRELASQIDENIKSYSKNLKLSTKVIFGGVGYQPQIQALTNGLDILVATPGRLLDLMKEGHVKYDNLEFFVLDEADQMLDMGFINDIKKIISELPQNKQTLLFSATMPKTIASLATTLLKDPVRVEVTPQATTIEKIEQKVYFLKKTDKPNLLKTILKDESLSKVLVFSRTKYGANRIVQQLEREGITAAAIHGNKSQSAREKALKSFKQEKIRVLVATDIAARGIDIPRVGHIVNFNLPEDPKSYVHRIGRTARAGAEGVAISFCEASEVSLLRGIEKCIRKIIPAIIDQPYHEEFSDADIQMSRPKKRNFSRKKKPRGHGKNGNRRF